MAYKTRKAPDAMLFSLVKAWNAKQEASVASFFHADVTQVTTGHYSNQTVTNETPALSVGGVPTDAATCVSFSVGLKALLNRHFADTRAHNTAVSSAIATADATDLTTALTLGNALKAAYNTHCAAANVHFNNDGTNTIAAADGTDLTTCIALLTEMRTDVGAHVISAPLGNMIELTNA